MCQSPFSASPLRRGIRLLGFSASPGNSASRLLGFAREFGFSASRLRPGIRLLGFSASPPLPRAPFTTALMKQWNIISPDTNSQTFCRNFHRLAFSWDSDDVQAAVFLIPQGFDFNNQPPPPRIIPVSK